MTQSYSAIYDTVKVWDRESQLRLFSDLGIFSDLAQMLLSFKKSEPQTKHTLETAQSTDKKELVFPKIPKGFKISPTVEAMSFNVPKDFDLEKEIDNMWEERTR